MAQRNAWSNTELSCRAAISEIPRVAFWTSYPGFTPKRCQLNSPVSDSTCSGKYNVPFGGGLSHFGDWCTDDNAATSDHCDYSRSSISLLDSLQLIYGLCTYVCFIFMFCTVALYMIYICGIYNLFNFFFHTLQRCTFILHMFNIIPLSTKYYVYSAGEFLWKMAPMVSTDIMPLPNSSHILDNSFMISTQKCKSSGVIF